MNMIIILIMFNLFLSNIGLENPTNVSCIHLLFTLYLTFDLIFHNKTLYFDYKSLMLKG